ncbi:alpha-amylase/4-alpha-glucanotransferase domain-containing protein [Candidatus Omnitrophota bacterium]
MNKKMLYVSEKLEKLKDSKKKTDLVKEAEKELFRGQCNCAYWHGVFGGLYLYHLRNAVYEHLIKGEAIIDQGLMGKKQCANVDVRDIDADGLDEVILENRDINLYFSPEEGGVLKELDSKKIGQNFINTLRRKKEAYHRKIIKKLQEAALKENDDNVKTIHDDIQAVDPSLSEHLSYDWYGRYSLIDHFISDDTTLADFSKSSYDELGDFVNGTYEYEVKKTSKGFDLLMKREGEADGAKVLLEKKISFPSKGTNFAVKYTLTNLEDEKKEFIFGPEFNIIMPEADSDKYKVITSSDKDTRQLGHLFESKDAESIEIRDTGDKASLLLDLGEKCDIWHFPVKTVSQSEKAYELNYQGSSIFPHFKVELDAGGSKKFTVKADIRV